MRVKGGEREGEGLRNADDDEEVEFQFVVGCT